MVNIAEICKKYDVNERIIREIIRLQAVNNKTHRLREIEDLLDDS